MRMQFVSSSKMGQHLAISLGNLGIDLMNEYKSEEFPADKMLDFKHWRTNHGDYLRKEEMRDCALKPVDTFPFHNDFTCCIISTASEYKDF